jgi:hypothetical protein
LLLKSLPFLFCLIVFLFLTVGGFKERWRRTEKWSLSTSMSWYLHLRNIFLSSLPMKMRSSWCGFFERMWSQLPQCFDLKKVTGENMPCITIMLRNSCPALLVLEREWGPQTLP